MNIQLEQNEFDFICNVLGELPTKSGAFIVLQKLKLQNASTAMPETKEAPTETN